MQLVSHYPCNCNRALQILHCCLDGDAKNCAATKRIPFVKFNVLKKIQQVGICGAGRLSDVCKRSFFTLLVKMKLAQNYFCDWKEDIILQEKLLMVNA